MALAVGGQALTARAPMDFRKYAARETTALVSRLVAAASEKASGDLQALRHAFDLVAGAIDEAVARQSGPEYRDEVAALADRLSAEAVTQAEAAGERAREQAQAALEQAGAALQAKVAENSTLKVALVNARAEAGRLALELQAQETITEAARAESKRSLASRQAAEAVWLELEAALETARGERGAIDDELRGVRERLGSAEADAARAAAQRNDDHAGALRALQARLDAATATAATLRQRADTAKRETERIRAEAELAAQASMRASRALEEADGRGARLLVEQAETIREHAALFLSSSLDRLLAMYLTVASSATIDDVLAAVVDALAVLFPRVALFGVQSNHLEGVRQVGFDLRADISQVLIPRTLDSLMAQAAASARIETRAAAELAGTSVPFGGTPDFALALPFVIDGQPLAVVYADDAEQPHREFANAELRLKLAQLLQCHAIPLLTRLAAEARALAELDAYATLLLNELEQTYAGNVAADTPDADRQQPLKENLEYARRLYAERVAAEGPQTAGLFEQRLLATAASRAATPFGRDLQALVGVDMAAPEAAAASGAAS